MIIFYEKETGNIVGTVGGRIHQEDEMKMFIGDKEKNSRIVCNWKKKGGKYEPETQKDVFELLDRDLSSIKKFRIRDGKLTKLDKNEV